MDKEPSVDAHKTAAEPPQSDRNGATASRVRRRTLRYLRRIVAGTGVVGAATCVPGCDPAPPPVDCTTDLTANEFDDWAYFRGQWVQTEGQSVILVQIDVWDFEAKLSFAGPPTLQGATLGETQLTDTNLAFVCTPVPGETSVGMSIPVKCEASDYIVALVMDVSRPAQLGDGVPIMVSE